MVEILTIAAGLVLLVVAGDLLVRGAVSGGLKYGVPAIVIGLTIVSFGTSAPELFVTIQASLAGSPGIAVGNVVGSNIANILLVIGLPALLAPLGDDSTETRRNYLIMVGVTFIAVGLTYSSPLTWWQGALLLSMLGLFLLDIYRCAVTSEGTCDPEAIEGLDDGDPSMPVWRIAGMVVLGIAGLPVGAHLVVDGAQSLALSAGISEEAIGLTLIALGTSLPELATTMMAAIRGRADVAIGNVIGSNIFNLLCILGVAATLDEIVIPQEFYTLNMWVMIASAMVLAPFILMRIKVNRVAGGVFCAAYALYVFAILSPAAPVGAGGVAEARPVAAAAN